MVLAHASLLLSRTNTTLLLLFLETEVSFPFHSPGLEKLLSIDDTANRELGVFSGIPIPFKDEGLLENKKDNTPFADWGNDTTASIQYSYVG